MRLGLIFALSLAGLGSNIAFRIADPLVTQIADSLHIAVTTAALLATAYALPYAIFQPILGPIGDVFGKGLLIRTSLIVLACGLFTCAVAPNAHILFAGRMLCGAAAGGIIPAAFALIGDRVPIAERQVSISRIMLLILVAQIAGAGGAGLLAGMIGWRGVFAAAGVVTATVALVTFQSFAPRSRGSGDRLSLRRAIDGYRDVFANPMAMPLYILTVLEGASIFATHPFVAPILREREGAGAFEAGMILAAFGVGALTYTLTVQLLLRLLGQRRMAILGALIAGAVLIVFSLSRSWLIDTGAFAVLGFSFLMLHNPLQAVATTLSETARGSAVALFALSLFLGQAIGPPIFGYISNVAGWSVAIACEATAVASLGLIAALFVFRDHRANS